MDEKTLAEKDAEKRREYKRRWNAENRDKVREHTLRYWERKVLEEVNNHDTDTTVNA
jgi:hypothetical protein